MKIRVVDVRFFVTECVTRIPFRFGIVTLERCPLCLAAVEIQSDAASSMRGYASDLLVPKWFEKDPSRSAGDDSRALLESAFSAAREARERASGGGETVFDLWWRIYRAAMSDSGRSARPPLVRGFGVALVERALIDASCRAAGLDFSTALKRDLFGFRPQRAQPELADWRLAESLDASPRSTLEVRHTVGLVDALRRADVPAADLGDDDHPLSLEEDIERYGLAWFKVKIHGDLPRDLERLRRIAAVLEEKTAGHYRLTLDGNEQVDSIADLLKLFERLAESREGQRLLDRLSYIEQPLPRAASLDSSRVDRDRLAALDDFGGVILDEADSGLEAWPRAIELGYRGISVKNCKGVFRALINRGLCELHSTADRRLFQSSEDLTNLPIYALQQDLATAAVLGLEHSERNGHHYFRGLDHLSPTEIAAALDRHPTLYRSEPTPRLSIELGRLDLRSVWKAGYGTDLEPDLDPATTVWSEVASPKNLGAVSLESVPLATESSSEEPNR